MRIIEKKVKNDVLILDENDLRRKGIQIPNRSFISGQLELIEKKLFNGH
jgi:hypothetical protein